MVGIYKITNPKNQIYIGQSIDIDKRKYYYQRLQCKGQIKLYNSLKKYGWENHTFEIIEECDLNQLNEQEIYWKQIFNSVDKGLNCQLHDKGGGPRNSKTKTKISNSQRGIKKHSSESKTLLSNKLKGNSNKKGKKLTQEQCLKISQSKTNHPMYTDEWKEKISKSNKGKKFTKEHKDKLSKSKLGKKLTQEHINKIKIKKSKPVLQFNKQGKFIKEWNSAKEAATELGFASNSNISNVCNGRLKTYMGFIWKHG